MTKILAFDIGGTKIAFSIINEKGELLQPREKRPTPPLAEDIFKLLKQIADEHDNEFDAVAVATAGAVDPGNQKIVSSIPNMPKGYDKTNFQAISTKPVLVENDANAVAWAEYRQGAAKGLHDVVVVAIGTGLGLGIIINDRMLKGKSGSGAEAHYPINMGKHRQCACGCYDCFEIYASGKALALDAQEAFSNPEMTSHDLIKLKQEGSPAAQEVFERWSRDIVSGIRGLACLFDPEMVVLFGSLAEFMDEEKMELEANDNIVAAPFVIRKARFGNDAAMIGAALLAVDKFNNHN